MTLRAQAPAAVLRLGVYAGIGLLLLTPFVISPGTIFPFIVGKALWSRSIIEAVFALWAALALIDPAYRPPRSRVLAALAAGLGVGLLAAWFGVSPQRSLWSSYERMLGVVDTAHWVALAVVLASVLRSAAHWRRLLGANAAVAGAMACLIVARHHELDVPFYATVPERHLPRMSGPFDNPTYLSAYLLVNLLLALGLAVRAWLPAGAVPEAGVPGAAVPEAAAPRGRKRGRRRARESAARPGRAAARWRFGLAWRAAARWRAALAWGAAAGLCLWGFALAGSVGGFAGLFAAACFAALASLSLAGRRVRRIAAGALVVLAVLAAGVGIRFADPDRTAAPWIDHPLVRYVADVHVQRPGVQMRLAAWEAGLEGFAARPALGWGPENFIEAFGRFASGYGAVTEAHDQAHGKLVEVAASTGVAGLAAYLALWAFAFVALWRAARRMEAREKAFAIGAGAALAGAFVQSQFLFDTPAGLLQTTLLLAFAAGLEASARARPGRLRLPARLLQRCAALLRRRDARAVLAGAAFALALGGLATNHAIWAGADVRYLPMRPWSWSAMAGGIEGFRPLANTWRWWLFNELGHHWGRIRAEDAARARRLLEWAGREADEALRTEPESWRTRHSLAWLYRAAAATDPEYAETARRHLEQARALAPARAVFPPVLRAPDGLAWRRLGDGRVELRWRWPQGAGYVTVKERQGDGSWRHILHAYEPARTTFVPPGGRAAGIGRYRIKACLYPGRCSASVEWPASGGGERR